MKKKNFLSGIGAKLALLTLAISGALMTGCYKDSSIDAPKPGEPVVLPEASYTISGSVIDAKTGANITDATLSVNAGVATTNIIDNGVYTVKVNKFSEEKIDVNLTFTAPGYNEGNAITRTVSLAKIKDGETATYPLSVAMMPNKTPEKNKLVKYKVEFNIKDVTNDATVVPSNVQVVEPAQPFVAEGGTTFVVRTNETDKYKAQTTSVTLPKEYVEEDDTKDHKVTIYVSPKEDVTPEPDETIYSTISGSVTDKNGNAVSATIELKEIGGTVKTTVENANTFSFTLNSKEHTSEYEIVATASDQTIKSGVYTAMSGNKDIVMVFPELGGEAKTYTKNYDLKFFAKNSETLENITTATFEFDGATGDSKNDVAAGSYMLHAFAKGYVAGKVVVELAEVKGENEETIKKNIFVYLTKKAVEPEPEPEFIKVNLYGEVRDKRGFIVPAQSIYLTGEYATAAPLYNASTYHFVVEVPADKADEKITWTAKAEVKKKDGIVRQSTVYSYIKGVTSMTQSIQFEAFNINEDGVVIEAQEPEGGSGSGTVTPPVDDEGKVTETTTIELTGTNPVTEEKDKTTLIIEKDTEIKDANGNPLAASIVVSRDTEEEKDPSGEVAAEEQVVAIRSYEGFPNGATFSKPILFTFADVYGGDLGNLQLEYLKDGKWINEGEPAVELAANTYTMKVPHFSKFRAAIKSKFEAKEDGTNENVKPVLVDRMNNNETAISITLKLKNVPSGSKYSEPLETIIAKSDLTTEASKKIVKNAIEKYFENQGMVVKDDYETVAQEYKYENSLPAYSLLKQVRYTITEKTVAYTLKINEKEIPFKVVTIEKVITNALENGVDYQVIGHSHTHGHGDFNNAGGGIVEAE